MKLPFQHKEGEEEGTIPINEVKKLRGEGKSDKEIINQLKNHGYSFQVIEKAMLQALREGTGPKQKSEQGTPQAPQQQYGTQAPPQSGPGRQRTEAEGQARGELPTREEIMPRPRLSVPATGQVPLEAQFEPTDLIEEVVEGVVEEKFEKLDSKFEYINNEQEKLKKENEKLKNMIGTSMQKEDKSIDKLREEIEKLRGEIEDLTVRSNAFERAFKQFLPDIFAKIREKKWEDKGIKVLDEMKDKEEREGKSKEEGRKERFSDW